MTTEVKINPELLYAFAYYHEGSHHDKSELRCRIVQAQTDEYYPIDGKFNVEFYARLKDQSWPDIVFYRKFFVEKDWPGNTLEAKISRYLTEKLKLVQEEHKAQSKIMEQLLKPIGI